MDKTTKAITLTEQQYDEIKRWAVALLSMPKLQEIRNRDSAVYPLKDEAMWVVEFLTQKPIKEVSAESIRTHLIGKIVDHNQLQGKKKPHKEVLSNVPSRTEIATMLTKVRAILSCLKFTDGTWPVLNKRPSEKTQSICYRIEGRCPVHLERSGAECPQVFFQENDLQVRVKFTSDKLFSYVSTIGEKWGISPEQFLKETLNHFDVTKGELSYDGLLAGVEELAAERVEGRNCIDVTISPVWFSSMSYFLHRYTDTLIPPKQGKKENELTIAQVFPVEGTLPTPSSDRKYSAPLQPLKICLVVIVEENGREYAVLPKHPSYRNELSGGSERTVTFRGGIEFESVDEIENKLPKFQSDARLLKSLALRLLYQETGLKARESELKWKGITMSTLCLKQTAEGRSSIMSPILIGVVKPMRMHEAGALSRSDMQMIFSRRKFKAFLDPYSLEPLDDAFVNLDDFERLQKASKWKNSMDPIALAVLQLLQNRDFLR